MASTITTTIPAFPNPAPNIQTQSQVEFSQNADSAFSHLIDVVTDFNSMASEMNTVAEEVAVFANNSTYMGALATAPTVNGIGDPLAAGDWYFNTTDSRPYIYDGATFVIAYALPADYYTKDEVNIAFAPLANPALTGTPTAPTQTAGDDSTAIATTAYVNALSGATIATGSATFTNSTNNISLTGIGIGVEVGDVIQISGSTSNNGEFTIEVITDDNNVIVNQAHSGGTTSKSLVDETATVNIILLCKWYLAPIGLGQGWVDVAADRISGVGETNHTGRTIKVKVMTLNVGSNWEFYVDGIRKPYASASGMYYAMQTADFEVPRGSIYAASYPGDSTPHTYMEMR